ncbi:MAG: hypothetical protein GTO30_12885 [Acidobacteria bacterium]|nr:hypothetical protein [Acidobacteriota bacterium]NIQ84863.1 hypothetical protein [Acidobacteriota bacterium]
MNQRPYVPPKILTIEANEILERIGPAQGCHGSIGQDSDPIGGAISDPD